ncbi:MAG TPA: glycerol-3-phosphate 1-O-acyltransferase [Gammaproteobacteria bacterium]|nr:glycerol-3-phosphate 1-O-acyltransferase [Gammaproteobacteria bacterium]
MIYSLPVLGYLLGSLSSAVIICRLMGLPDPRSSGSGNPGATNVLRFGNKLAAVLTLIGDLLKGLAPVLVARWLDAGVLIIAATATAAFLGHLFPLFFQFKGGKGVATAFGVYLALDLRLAMALLATWMIIAFASRYSSLAALSAAVLAPVYVYLISHQVAYVVTTTLIAILILWRHQSNIQRLQAGQEDKIHLARKKSARK